MAIDAFANNGFAHDIPVNNCTILHGHGPSIGSITNGGAANVTIATNTLLEPIKSILSAYCLWP